MTFEWDENKNKINKKKHDGVSFEIAARVFLDSRGGFHTPTLAS